jgi:DNA-binding transcriptional ArsR family regulator
MNAEEKRQQRLSLLEDEIGRKLAESVAAGELRHARSWGKPLELGDGYDETPTELRMGMKILKDAGVVPAEVELMREIETLRLALVDAGDDEAARAGRQRLSEMQQALALRLEKLRMTGSL